MADNKNKTTNKSANKSTDKNRQNASVQRSQYRRSSVERPQNRTGQSRSASTVRDSRTRQKTAQPTKKTLREKYADLSADRATLIKTMTKLFIALCLIMVLIIAWRNRVEWSCANIRQCVRDSTVTTEGGGGFPVTVAGSRTVALDELAGNIAVLSDNMFIVYSSSSGEATSDSHYMSSPALKTAGRYALLYDIGNRKYILEAASGSITTGTTENAIIAGAVSRDGSYCIVQQNSDLSSSLLSTVEVYSLSGELLHKWHSADWHIIGAALSSDGSRLALSGVSAHDGLLQSALILQTVGSEKELARITATDNIYVDLEFSVNDVLFAVGSEVLTIVKNLGKEHQHVALSGDLVAYDIDYNYGLALFTADDSGADSGDLYMYDTRGRERFVQAVPLVGLSVSVYDSGCCVLGRGEMRAYQNNGELYGSWDVELGCNDVVVIGGKAYLLEGVKITQQKLKRNVQD